MQTRSKSRARDQEKSQSPVVFDPISENKHRVGGKCKENKINDRESLYSFYYLGELLLETWEVCDGIKHGINILYDPHTGIIQRKTNWVNGLQEGIEQFFYLNYVDREIEYINGIMVIMTEYYPSGIAKLIFHYNNSEVIHKEWFDKQGIRMDID